MSPFDIMRHNLMIRQNIQHPEYQRQYVGQGSQGFMPMNMPAQGYAGQQSGMPSQQITPEKMQQYAEILKKTGKLGKKPDEGQGGMGEAWSQDGTGISSGAE